MLAKVFGLARLQLNDIMAIFILKESSRLPRTFGYPFHLTRYCKTIRFLLWSKTSSTINLSSPSRSMIGAGGGTLLPSMSEGKYFFSAVTLNTGWQWRVWGRSRRKAFSEMLSTTLKGPNHIERSLWQGRAPASGVTKNSLCTRTWSPTPTFNSTRPLSE